MIAARESITRRQMLDEESQPDPELIARMELVDQDQDRLAERIGTYDLLDELWNDPPHSQSSVAAWNSSLGRTHGTWQGMLLGEASTIELSYPHHTDTYPSQVVSALVAAALVLCAVALACNTRVPEWFRGRPRYTFIAFGIFWWLFLWPSAAGWAIVLAALLFPYLKGPVSRAHRRKHPSAQVA
jgi:hypothetical protein